jgi:hypothetical protein
MMELAINLATKSRVPGFRGIFGSSGDAVFAWEPRRALFTPLVAAVKGGHDPEPFVELFVKIFEIESGCARRFEGIFSLVDPRGQSSGHRRAQFRR